MNLPFYLQPRKHPLAKHPDERFWQGVFWASLVSAVFWGALVWVVW